MKEREWEETGQRGITDLSSTGEAADLGAQVEGLRGARGAAEPEAAGRQLQCLPTELRDGDLDDTTCSGSLNQSERGLCSPLIGLPRPLLRAIQP